MKRVGDDSALDSDYGQEGKRARTEVMRLSRSRGSRSRSGGRVFCFAWLPLSDVCAYPASPNSRKYVLFNCYFLHTSSQDGHFAPSGRRGRGRGGSRSKGNRFESRLPTMVYRYGLLPPSSTTRVNDSIAYPILRPSPSHIVDIRDTPPGAVLAAPLPNPPSPPCPPSSTPSPSSPPSITLQGGRPAP